MMNDDMGIAKHRLGQRANQQEQTPEIRLFVANSLSATLSVLQ
jgi:hypothetical protein